MNKAVKFLLPALASLGCVLPAAQAQQAEGPWMVRVRAVNIDTANESDAIAPFRIPTNGIHVSNKTIPEVDISYFFTKNLAAELILTYPQKHNVRIAASAVGAFDAGSFKHLPPTLSLQYHFMPDSQFRPYVGVGINYTRISSVNLGPLGAVTGGSMTLENDSWGGALQLGFDVKVGSNSYINFDVKKVYLESDLMMNGAKVSTVKVDPLLIGVGYGFKF